jgi:ABC-2 type transport system ATP-binding protein
MEGQIEIRHLSKTYGKSVALDDVTLSFEGGKIYGLSGRNGAGKTTLLHLINAHLFPTKGKILVDGEEPSENPRALRKLCFIRESGNFKPTLKVRDVLGLAALAYPRWDQAFAEELLKVFNLDPSKKVKALSKGMGSALGVTVGMASRAAVTIFDEPYIGMDVVHRQQFYDLLLEDYTQQPRTIILSTHLIDEVSKVFEGVVILDQGRVMMQEETEVLRQKAFYLQGETKLVDELAQGLKIIHEETLGSTKQAAILGELSTDLVTRAKQMGITIESLPIQKLMVYLTTRTERGAEHASA